MLDVLKEHGVDTEDMNKNRAVDSLWKILRKDIAGPAFLVNIPKFMSPLAKSNPDDPQVTERYHPLFAGSELGNGYSELNDPIDQFQRFKEQQEMRNFRLWTFREVILVHRRCKRQRGSAFPSAQTRSGQHYQRDLRH